MLDPLDGHKQQSLSMPATVDKHNPTSLLNQLQKSGIHDRVIFTLRDFFAEKITSKASEDQQYFIGLATELTSILNQYSGMNLKIMLMQRLIMYGINSRHLVSYYYDVFMRLNEDFKPEHRRKLVARLIKKTEVAELHRWYEEYPTLKESIQEQLYAWIKNIEKEEFGFFTARDSHLGPIHKLGVTPAVFMNIYRSMEETNVLKPLTFREPLYNYMSQVIMSNNGLKLEPKTFKNRFVYDDVKSIQASIDIVNKMKQALIDAREIALRR